jgi:hypothetical protein
MLMVSSGTVGARPAGDFDGLGFDNADAASAGLAAAAGCAGDAVTRIATTATAAAAARAFPDPREILTGGPPFLCDTISEIVTT